MPTDTIIMTLLSAAAFLKEPIRAIASQSLRDVYEATRYYLRKKFGTASPAATALELATDKPDSAARNAMLIKEAALAQLDRDADLVLLVQTLAALLGDLGAVLGRRSKGVGRTQRGLFGGSRGHRNAEVVEPVRLSSLAHFAERRPLGRPKRGCWTFPKIKLGRMRPASGRRRRTPDILP